MSTQDLPKGNSKEQAYTNLTSTKFSTLQNDLEKVVLGEFRNAESFSPVVEELYITSWKKIRARS